MDSVSWLGKKVNFFSRYSFIFLSKYFMLVVGKLVLLWLQLCSFAFYVSKPDLTLSQGPVYAAETGALAPCL